MNAFDRFPDRERSPARHIQQKCQVALVLKDGVRTGPLQATEAPRGVAQRTVAAEYLVWQDAMS
jgi:hypothetical protein